MLLCPTADMNTSIGVNRRASRVLLATIHSQRPRDGDLEVARQENSIERSEFVYTRE